MNGILKEHFAVKEVKIDLFFYGVNSEVMAEMEFTYLDLLSVRVVQESSGNLRKPKIRTIAGLNESNFTLLYIKGMDTSYEEISNRT